MIWSRGMSLKSLWVSAVENSGGRKAGSAGLVLAGTVIGAASFRSCSARMMSLEGSTNPTLEVILGVQEHENEKDFGVLTAPRSNSDGKFPSLMLLDMRGVSYWLDWRRGRSRRESNVRYISASQGWLEDDCRDHMVTAQSYNSS